MRSIKAKAIRKAIRKQFASGTGDYKDARIQELESELYGLRAENKYLKIQLGEAVKSGGEIKPVNAETHEIVEDLPAIMG